MFQCIAFRAEQDAKRTELVEKIDKLQSMVIALCPSKTLSSIDNIVAQQQGEIHGIYLHVFVILQLKNLFHTFSRNDSSSGTTASITADVSTNSGCS